jgi:hypothetical protein
MLILRTLEMPKMRRTTNIARSKAADHMNRANARESRKRISRIEGEGLLSGRLSVP